jgi:hypothetical protein
MDACKAVSINQFSFSVNKKTGIKKRKSPMKNYALFAQQESRPKAGTAFILTNKPEVYGVGTPL